MDAIFLTLAEVIEIHNYQIKNFGGSPGLRDVNLLKSALNMPCATFGKTFLHPSIHEMAAGYLFHLVQKHPFVDGNKRVGAMAGLVFLELNGYEFTAEPDDLTAMVLRVAQGMMLKPEIAIYLRRNSNRL
jgi:death-on-curing protein